MFSLVHAVPQWQLQFWEGLKHPSDLSWCLLKSVRFVLGFRGGRIQAKVFAFQVKYQESTLISHLPCFSSSLQEWTYTYNHQVRQQQLCLSVYTLFPGSQVLLSPCKEGDNKQVSPVIDPLFSLKFSFFQHSITAHQIAHVLWLPLGSTVYLGVQTLACSALCLLNECVDKDVY